VIITGIDVPVSISVVGGEYSINGGTFSSAAGLIGGGDQFVVRVATSDSTHRSFPAWP
jgi:hypothetical protein